MAQDALFRLCRAKINLFLEITGKRPDGYHDIVSVFQEIDLADRLWAEPSPDGEITLSCDDPSLPADGGNLVVKAARLLREVAGARKGIRFRLEKSIPAGGGLGGGSSDAAGALELANDLWKTGLSRGELLAIGEKIGSDVPFFLFGGTCLCEGRGERIRPLPPPPPGLSLGLILPNIGVSTAMAYGALNGFGDRRPVGAFLAAWAAGDREGIRREAFNRFEETVWRLVPELGIMGRELTRLGLGGVRLSGSGSCMWFMDDPAGAGAILAGAELPAGLSARCLACRPVPRAIPAFDYTIHKRNISSVPRLGPYHE